MKKSILTLVALGVTASVMGQGYVNFSTRVSGVVVGHVYGSAGELPKSGNTASETPAGAQTYSGTLLAGTGFSATLWAAPGVATENDLVLVPGSITTFRTGASLGGTPQPLVLSVPNVAIHASGTFQVRAWDNNNGAYTSYAQALAANGATGKSDIFQVSNLGDGVLDFPADMVNFRSFNLTATAVPEPSTFVLAGLGAAALVIFRRRK